jgi:hypothetical protein
MIFMLGVSVGTIGVNKSLRHMQVCMRVWVKVWV